MTLVERAKADLIKMKEAMDTGFENMGLGWINPLDQVYRKELIDAIEKAIIHAEHYGDDALYDCYRKGAHELWIGCLKDILTKTLLDLEQGRLLRVTSYDVIKSKDKTICALQMQVDTLSKHNQYLLDKIASLQAEYLNDNFEDNVQPETGEYLSASLLLDLNHVITLAKQFEYAKAASLLELSSRRCLDQLIARDNAGSLVSISELNHVKNLLTECVANQILTELKNGDLKPQFVETGIGKLFFSNPHSAFLQRFSEVLFEQNISFLVTDHHFKSKQDLVTYVMCCTQLIKEYVKEEHLWHDPAVPAFIFKRSLKIYQQTKLASKANEIGADPSVILERKKIDELKSYRNQIAHDLIQVKKVLENFAESTNEYKFFKFIGASTSQTWHDLVKIPANYLLETVELFISPATATAKKLGQLTAEMKNTSLNNSAKELAKPIKYYEQLYQQLESLLAILDTLITSLVNKGSQIEKTSEKFIGEGKKMSFFSS